MSSRSLRWILTGPIGSGKSTVGDFLREHGITVIDADLIGHEILQPGGPAFDDVVDRWPEVITNGRIDRRKLGRIVFGDSDQLRELEGFTHPHIKERVSALDREMGLLPLIVEISVLKELAPEQWGRLVVDAPVEVRKARLAQRGMAADDIDRRMAVQPPREEWLEAATVVIDNSGPVDMTERQLEGFLGSFFDRDSRHDPEDRNRADPSQ